MFIFNRLVYSRKHSLNLIRSPARSQWSPSHNNGVSCYQRSTPKIARAAKFNTRLTLVNQVLAVTS